MSSYQTANLMTECRALGLTIVMDTGGYNIYNEQNILLFIGDENVEVFLRGFREGRKSKEK